MEASALPLSVSNNMLQWSSGNITDCNMRRSHNEKISLQEVVFIIIRATVIYSLVCCVHALTVVARSTQPSTISETGERLSAYRLSNNNAL